MTPSEIACSMKPCGAITSTVPLATSAAATSPATIMVNVRMAVDQRRYGDLAKVLRQKIEGCPSGCWGAASIKRNPSRFAAHEGEVRQIISPDLINAGDDFVQTVLKVQLRIAPEARIHRGGRIILTRNEG